MKNKITKEDFYELTESLNGLPVSLTWRGYGTAIFIEFGKLKKSSKNKPTGLYSLMIEWSWRVEKPRSIWFSSFSNDDEITDLLPELQGKKVNKIYLSGVLPEITIEFEDHYRISSFSMETSQPQWTIFLPNRSWCHVERGSLYHEDKNV